MTPAKRFTTSETAYVEVYGKTGVFKAALKNISQSGAYIEWDELPMTLEKGDILRLTVFLDQVKKSRNFSAELVWAKDTSAGICFIKPEQVVEKMMAKI